MMPNSLRFATWALILLALPAGSRPQAPPEFELLDGGTFTLYLGGTRIGEEHFIIRQERAGTAGPVYRAGAELNLKLEGQTVRISVALEALGSECRPRRYELKINGSQATSVVGTLVRDRIRLEVRSPRGDEMKEFLLRGKAAIVDTNIAHHHFFIWKLLQGNCSGGVTVIIPRERLQQTVTLEDRGDERVQIEGREMQLRHIAMVTEAGNTHHAWLDGDKLIKVEIPDRQFLAVRSESVSP